MKKFFLNLLSSFMGAWIAIVLSGVVAVIIIFSLVGGVVGGSVESVKDGCILRIGLDGEIVERDMSSQIDVMSLLKKDFNTPQSVSTLVTAINEAATDNRVKSIYLDCGYLSASPASLHAIRNALLEFKTSKKKIYAYADVMTQGAYFVASVADEISLNPAGNFNLRGLGGQSLFYKGLFDKVGVSFQAVRVGKGKAAVEPYTADTMSQVARAQNIALLDTLWIQMRREIASSRNAVTPALIDTLIDRDYISSKPASFAVSNKLVDKLEYRHVFEDRIAKLAKQDDGLENVVTPSALAAASATMSENVGASNQIAVLYASGGIDDFMGSGGISSPDMVDQILELSKNDDVKALVLRVNSPGGSAFGSEQMWEALETFKKTGKTFVVSMGDYAASGGYYISCGADRIFADPFTITGSIGIFGLIPNIKGLVDKIGLSVQTVATNPNGLYPAVFTPMDEQQLAAMQAMVEDGYNLFVKRVAEGRKLPVAKVKEVADGRPLSAVVARGHGLVDDLGSLQNAIDWAKKKAKVERENVVIYPKPDMNFVKLMGSINKSVLFKLLSADDPAALGEEAVFVLQNMFDRDMVMARMYPFEVKL